MPMVDITGKTFGRLTVICFSHKDTRRQLYWKCLCSCGNEKIICGNRLKNGNTKSCGCLLSEWAKKLGSELHQSKHGMYGSRTYNIWHLMIKRCNNRNSTGYKYYGGRGIVVCENWKVFENFYKDMGECPNGLTLDRIDSNSGYSKENCRWATRKEQQNNMRNNKFLTRGGITKTVSQWAEKLNINRGTLQKRIDMGWTDDRCLAK